jgi:predicted nucleic acid-binding protein
MYAAGKDHPNRAPALRFLERVTSRDVEGCTSTEVLQEILWRYSYLNRKDLAAKCYDLFVQICPTIFPVSLTDTNLARDLLMSAKSISARDAVHAAVMLNHKVNHIASFDSGFDEIRGIQRISTG